MSSITETLFDNPIGRTALLSALIALFLLFFAWVIPLAENTTEAWYSFLYKDLSTPESQRYNFALVILETILLTLFYFFSLIFLGSIAELRNNLPSWGEVVIAMIFTLTLAFFLPRISVGGGIGGTESSTGYNNFTSSMQTTVFWLTFLGIILMTMYINYSDDGKNE